MSAHASEVTRRRFDWLLSAWVVFAGICIGVAIGLGEKEYAATLAPFGQLYLALLQMSILPIMISAVIVSLGRLLQSQEKSRRQVANIALIFAAGLMLSAVIAVGAGESLSPGMNLKSDSKEIFGHEIARSELSSDVVPDFVPPIRLVDFFVEMVPRNIFKAASEGNNLPILFFSVVIGVALGMMNASRSEPALKVADAVYESMLKLIGWLMYGLPFGLCFIIASSISHLGISIFFAMLNLIIVIYAVSFILLVVYGFIIIRYSNGVSFRQALAAMKDPLLVAFGTSSSFAAIPLMLKSLTMKLRCRKESVDLIVPLGLSLHPQGNVIHFVISTLFVAQLYNVDITGETYVVLIISAIFAAVAASGAPGIASLAMLSLVFTPLGLPLSVGIILLTAIDPVVDPVLTAVNVQANMAASAFLSEK